VPLCSMKLIPLYRSGQPEPVAFAKVDDEDYEWLLRLGPWRISLCGYAYLPRNGELVKMQNLVNAFHSTRHIVLDHINRDRVDNQKKNLRIATTAQNQHNAGMWRHNTSGYKGVTGKRGKWWARIRVGKKIINLGMFDSKEDAARAYDVSAVKLRGEFACTNASLGLLLAKEG